MKYIHKCQKCNNLFYSGNKCPNFFANNYTFYTDRFYKIRYLFVRCPYCYMIVEENKTCVFKEYPLPRISYKRKIGEEHKPWPHTDAKCINLNLMEYYKILNEKKLDIKQEAIIRLHILQLENDKRKSQYPIQYEVLYTDNEISNFKILKNLLNENQLGVHPLISVEINRYLKNFSKAFELLDNYKEEIWDENDFIKLEYELLKNEDIYVKSYCYSDATLEVKKRVRR